jgi:hypothetical protein
VVAGLKILLFITAGIILMTSLTSGGSDTVIRNLMQEMIAERDAKFAPKQDGGMFDKPEVKTNDTDVITDLLGYLEQKRIETLDSYQSKVMRRASKPLPKSEDIDVSSFLEEAGLTSQPAGLTALNFESPELGDTESEQIIQAKKVRPPKKMAELDVDAIEAAVESAVEEPAGKSLMSSLRPPVGKGLMSSPRPGAKPEPVNEGAPINVRNNNLGNIKNIKSNDWQGQTNLGSDETFAAFRSPELGVRALKKVIQANINATDTIEGYVNRYASEPKEKAYYKKNGKLMPHLKAYATQIAKSQGLNSTTAAIPEDVDMLAWIKATAKAEGGADALTYFTDDVINRGLAL